jgi:hypothetical protein
MIRKNLLAILLTTAAGMAHASSVASPDGRFRVEIGTNIDIDNAAGERVLQLAQGTGMDQRILVSWNAAGDRVVIVENSRRGSDVIAAWRQDGIWHKTGEAENEGNEFTAGLERQFGRIVSERRSIAGWVSPDALEIRGSMTFAGGHTVAYRYTLRFVGDQRVSVSRAGFEIGALQTSNYRVE